ncbi:hypothetical protein ACFE04_008374 [Oxalis oulophora]
MGRIEALRDRGPSTEDGSGREHLSRARALGDALLLGTVCSPCKPEGKPPGVFIFATRWLSESAGTLLSKEQFGSLSKQAKVEKDRFLAPSLLLSQEGTRFLAKPGNLRSIKDSWQKNKADAILDSLEELPLSAAPFRFGSTSSLSVIAISSSIGKPDPLTELGVNKAGKRIALIEGIRIKKSSWSNTRSGVVGRMVAPGSCSFDLLFSGNFFQRLSLFIAQENVLSALRVKLKDRE